MRFPLCPALLLAAVISFVPGTPAAAQNYSAGASASLVYSGGSGTAVSNLGTWGAQGFFEVQYEPGTRIQLRAGQFGMTGSSEGAPNLKVGHVQLLVSYLFKDTLADLGFIAGAGAYRVRPNSPEAGQIAVDPEENVFGLTIGMVSIFHLSHAWDVRLEGTLHYLFMEDRRSPILLTGGFAYNF